mmetsp:Transcript_15137/g.30546  ORF Transcript_15137/g.30546 Transcript_15137/m.30546 type:complete len:368 (+) Transcript_15137:3013-4116(+)
MRIAGRGVRHHTRRSSRLRFWADKRDSILVHAWVASVLVVVLFTISVLLLCFYLPSVKPIEPMGLRAIDPLFHAQSPTQKKREPKRGIEVGGQQEFGESSPSNASWRPSRDWISGCVKEFTEGPKQYLVRPFPVGWPDYRLGDCIKMCHKCADSSECQKDPEGIKCLTWTSRHDTFADFYDKRFCQSIPRGGSLKIGGNFSVVDAMLELGDERGYQAPEEDEVVVHLRLGDIIELSNDSVDRMLLLGGDPAHNKNFKNGIKSIGEYLDTLESSSLRKVRIRGGSHMFKYYRKSCVYSMCIKQAMEEAGYDVTMVLNGVSPDEDFYYGARARHLIVSVGGYSRLMGQMVERYGGTVHGRQFIKRKKSY